MSVQVRLRLLVCAALGCSFDATGLGESSGVPASTGASTSTDAGTTTGDPGSTSDLPTSSGTQAGSGDGSEAGSTGPPPSECGDGVLGGDEACDDGPDNAPTRPCTPVCGVNVCGDGYPLAPGEACDDGDQDDADQCHNDCTLPTTCGNAELDAGAQCDDANQLDTDACIACEKAHCGDGFVQQNVESCDDGPESAACNADCTLVLCGDLKQNASAGEVCDLGVKNGVYASGCAADCGSAGLSCGDGVVTASDENCDPQKPPPGASCTADCELLICADGRDDCDGDFANGCEIDLKTDEDHCGECGKKCQVFDCKGGSCQP